MGKGYAISTVLIIAILLFLSACSGPITKCMETDTGKDPLTTGVTYFAAAPHKDYCGRMNDTNQVYEYWCETPNDDILQAEWIACPNGCVDGACLPDGTVEDEDDETYETTPEGTDEVSQEEPQEEEMVQEHDEIDLEKFYDCPSLIQCGACDDLTMVWEPAPGERDWRIDPYTYEDDGCMAYRCLDGKTITPSCYNKNGCEEKCDTECIFIPLMARICGECADCGLRN